LKLFAVITLQDLQESQQRIRGVAVRTPLIACAHQDPSRALFFKPENLQPIGAFKLRGAYNKIASLSHSERQAGVITYSSGNHAQGVAYAARALGVKAIIVMPSTAPAIKRESTAQLGAEIVTVGPSGVERQERAEQLARDHGYTIVPPYNDEKIIAGQGTAGLEIVEDMPDLDCVLVPIGGGGLISGIATAIKLSCPKAKVIGVEPTFANDAQQSLRAGRIVKITAEQASRTLADGLRAMYLGDITFAHIQHYVDDIITVSESEIRQAVRLMALNAKLIAEPSGAVTFAAFLFHSAELPSLRKTVAVISGGNIEPSLLAEILQDNR
jgi:threonine dehydratase